MSQFNPFFINSNICLKQQDISNFNTFMDIIAGNTGNSYITYALLKELGVDASKICHIPSVYTHNFNEADLEYTQNASHIFLILQDQIRIAESYGLQLPYKKIENLIKKSKKPLVITGLGANSFTGFDKDFYKQLNPDLVHFLNFLSAHTPEIGVRGHFTAEVLNQIGIKNVRVIGCPSFYEMGANRVVQKTGKISLEDILLTHSSAVLSLKKNHQICQDFQEEEIIRTIAFNENVNLPKSAICKNILKHKYHIFSNIEDWKHFISQFKFAFGDRLHGSICALNAGIPAMCTNTDSRAREMCEFLHIPYYPHVTKDTDVLKLYEQADIDGLNKHYPTLFKNFCNFIEKNVGVIPFSRQATIEQPTLRLYSGKNIAGLKRSFIGKKLKNIFYHKKRDSIRILFFKFKTKKHQ